MFHHNFILYFKPIYRVFHNKLHWSVSLKKIKEKKKKKKTVVAQQVIDDIIYA